MQEGYPEVKTALIAVGIGFLIVWSFYIEPSSLSYKRYEITLDDWPTSQDSLSIAVIADLHVGAPYMPLERVKTIVQNVNNIKPDLILLAGDYSINHVIGGTFIESEPIAHELRKFKAKLGVFAVLGNHDWPLDSTKVKQPFEQVGIPVLDDEAIEIKSENYRFWLVGISDYWEGRHDVGKAFRGVPKDASVIVLTHNPDVFPELPRPVSIGLAGHTHGGQVRLPFIGSPVVPSFYGQRYIAGHIIENGKHFFVSPGIGTSIIPVRFRMPPEIPIITLRSAGTIQ